MLQQKTENNIFRVIFQIGFGIITAMILQNTISRFNLFRIESFDSGVCYFGGLRQQICWMSQQGTQNSVFRVIFRIGFSIRTAMILQNTISRFNLFRIESFDSGVCSFGELKKIFCWLSQQETEKSIFRVIFQIGFGIMTTMILQKTISRFNFFQFESFDSWVCYFGEPQKKMCWMSHQGTEKTISEIYFELALALWLQWFCKLPFPDSTSFELKVLIADCVTLNSREKTCVECFSKEQRRAFLELSFNWIIHYDWNDYHFQIQLISNWKFW